MSELFNENLSTAKNSAGPSSSRHRKRSPCFSIYLVSYITTALSRNDPQTWRNGLTKNMLLYIPAMVIYFILTYRLTKYLTCVLNHGFVIRGLQIFVFLFAGKLFQDACLPFVGVCVSWNRLVLGQLSVWASTYVNFLSSVRELKNLSSLEKFAPSE